MRAAGRHYAEALTVDVTRGVDGEHFVVAKDDGRVLARHPSLGVQRVWLEVEWWSRRRRRA